MQRSTARSPVVRPRPAVPDGRWRRLCASLLATLLVAACSAPPVPAAGGTAEAERRGVITDRRLAEVSGIALSRRDENLLWAVNDSDNPAALHALALDGEVVAVIPVAGVRNVDWEDLSAYTIDGQHWLAIADIGDNLGRRPWVSVILVPEPDLAATPEVATPARVVRFRYPDGARDAEGLAVDVARREFLVLSKRQTPPDLFAVSLDPAGADTDGSVRTARRVGTVAGLPPPTAADLAADPLTALYVAQPTALEYREDVGLVVLTYRRPYVFPRRGDEALAESLARGPVAVAMPRLKQAEAMTLRRRRVLVTSEQLPAPLLSLPLPEKAARTAVPVSSSGPATAPEDPGAALFLDLVN